MLLLRSFDLGHQCGETVHGVGAVDVGCLVHALELGLAVGEGDEVALGGDELEAAG
jgi:hypothetical protein